MINKKDKENLYLVVLQKTGRMGGGGWGRRWGAEGEKTTLRIHSRNLRNLQTHLFHS